MNIFLRYALFQQTLCRGYLPVHTLCIWAFSGQNTDTLSLIDINLEIMEDDNEGNNGADRIAQADDEVKYTIEKYACINFYCIADVRSKFL